MTLSLLLLLLIAGYSAADDGPLVEMPLGKVRGHTLTSRSGREYLAFTGLPYAKPPVGELRFQPPQPADLWRGVRDDKQYRGNCLQPKNLWLHIEGVEDCLYLDVYTLNVSQKAPVLVMFHGGGFFLGAKNIVKPNFLMDEEIVVVQANYRLGVFGFFTFETKDLAGNQGLKDQLMVLHWVKQNIGSFGGDPDRVTITGFSAGGASVHSHILSPLSRGLFHRAISTSGSMYNPWALSPPGLARENAQKLMTLIGCPTEPSKAIPCTIEKDAQLIVDHFPKFYNKSSEGRILAFSPVLEEAGSGGFLEAPISKWEDHNTVPLMTVVSSAEGLYLTSGLSSSPEAFGNFSSKLSELLPISLHYWASASQPDLVTRKAKEHYFPGKTDITMDDIANVTYMAGDAMFSYGVLKAANTHKGDVYLCFFDYLQPGSLEYNLSVGASHCGEVNFIWGSNMPGLESNDKSKQFVEFSKAIVKTIVQFMNDGTAKIPGTDLSWKKWSFKDQDYLHFDRKGVFSLKKGLLQDRYQFWENINYLDKLFKK